MDVYISESQKLYLEKLLNKELKKDPFDPNAMILLHKISDRNDVLMNIRDLSWDGWHE